MRRACDATFRADALQSTGAAAVGAHLVPVPDRISAGSLDDVLASRESKNKEEEEVMMMMMIMTMTKKKKRDTRRGSARRQRSHPNPGALAPSP